jgi:hypothetical protein
MVAISRVARQLPGVSPVWTPNPEKTLPFFERHRGALLTDERKDVAMSSSVKDLLSVLTKRVKHFAETDEHRQQLLELGSASATKSVGYEVPGDADGWRALFQNTSNFAALLHWCLENNFKLPLSFLAFRLGVKYLAGDAFLMVRGGATGRTYVGHADASGENDAQHKLFFINFSFYEKAVIHEKRNIAHAPSVYVKDYLGGNGVVPFTMDDVEEYRQGHTGGKTMHFVAVPPNWEPEAFVMDVMGYFDPVIAGHAEVARRHYPSADLYSQVWGWKHSGYNFRDLYKVSEEGSFNTVVFQTRQRFYRVKGPGHCVLEALCNHSPAGERAYVPGTGQRFKGSLEVFPPPVVSESGFSSQVTIR